MKARKLVNSAIRSLRDTVGAFAALRAINKLKRNGVDAYESNANIKMRVHSALLLVNNSRTIANVELQSVARKQYVSMVKTFLRSVLSDEAVREVFRITQSIQLFDDVATDWSLFIAKAKALTLIAKKYQNDLSTYWRYLVDLDLIAAYQVKKNLPNQADLIDWLSSKKWFGVQYDYLFSKAMDEIFDNLVPVMATDMDYSPSEFVERPYLWATSGASVESLRILPYRKTKWSLYYADKQLPLRLLLTTARNTLRPFVKPDEPLKSRFIVTASDGPFMKMAYMMLFSEATFRKFSPYPTFMSNDRWLSMCTQLISTMDSGFINLDLDQHNFDHFPTDFMVLEAVRHIIALSVQCSRMNATQIADIGVLLMRDFEQMFVTTDNFSFKWQNGVASGWRWTALIDTLINHAEAMVVDKIAALLYGSSAPLLRFVQGDDITERHQQLWDAQLRIVIWEFLHFDISKPKTLVGTKTSEFLRYTFGEKAMIGYASRLLHTMVVAYSEENEKKNAERLTICNYLQFCSRAQVPVNEELIEQRWKGVLHTPTILGGFGLTPLKIDLAFVQKIIKIKRNARFFGFELQRLGQHNGEVVKRAAFRKLQTINATRIDTTNAGISLSANYIDADAPYRIEESVQNLKQQVDSLVALLTPLSKSNYSQIQNNLTLRMKRLWLYGRLPLPTSYYRFNARVVSLVVESKARGFLGLARYRKISYNQWISTMLYVEEHLPEYVAELTPYTMTL